MIDIFDLVKSIDKLTVIFYPMKNISGACYKGRKSNIFLVNSNMSVEKQRFSIACELYYLYYDKSNINIFNLSKIEKKAYKFASNFLIPKLDLDKHIEKIKKLTVEDIINLKQTFKVSYEVMLDRLFDEKYIDNNDFKYMKNFKEYDTFLDNKIKVFGHYIKTANKILNKNYISQGKYEELLLDAFRSDIVYGI